MLKSETDVPHEDFNFAARVLPRILILLVFVLGGCSGNSRSKKTSANSISPGTQIPPEAIDIHVRDFTDTFMTRVAAPYSQIIAKAKSPEERAWALESRLGQATAALSDATGPNPAVNLLDAVALVTLKRMSIENYWIPNLLHDDGKDLLNAYKVSEKEIWDLAARTFTEEQIDELRELIAKWARENPSRYSTGFVKFSDFAGNGPLDPKQAQNLPSSLLGLLYIDPLASLDPVTQEAHGFRMLAERLVFIAMRAPLLMNLQIEDLTNRVLTSPDIQRIISSTEQYSKVGDRFNEIVAKYPVELSNITKNSIDQINASATQQREAIQKELNSESDQMHSILADARNSIIVARDAAASINENTRQTISVAENGGRRILNEVITGIIAIIVIGFIWPAIVLFGYRYAKNRWLHPN
jgi:hypothetical protein